MVGSAVFGWSWVWVGLSCKDRSGDYRGYAWSQDYGGGIFFVNDKIRDRALGVSGWGHNHRSRLRDPGLEWFCRWMLISPWVMTEIVLERMIVIQELRYSRSWLEKSLARPKRAEINFKGALSLVEANLQTDKCYVVWWEPDTTVELYQSLWSPGDTWAGFGGWVGMLPCEQGRKGHFIQRIFMFRATKAWKSMGDVECYNWVTLGELLIFPVSVFPFIKWR